MDKILEKSAVNCNDGPSFDPMMESFSLKLPMATRWRKSSLEQSNLPASCNWNCPQTTVMTGLPLAWISMVCQWMTWRVCCRVTPALSIVVQIKLRNDHDDGYIRAGRTSHMSSLVICLVTIKSSSVRLQENVMFPCLTSFLSFTEVEHFACMTQKIQIVRFSS